MYSTRQSLLDKGSKVKVDASQILIPLFVLQRRGARSLEQLVGIEKDTVLTNTGDIIKSTQYDPLTAIHADERVNTDISNSVPLRELLSDRNNLADVYPTTGTRLVRMPLRTPVDKGWSVSPRTHEPDYVTKSGTATNRGC